MAFRIPGNEEFKCVEVLPYIGSHYNQANRWGVAILILGESHYMAEGQAGQPLGPEFTRDVVGEVLDGRKKPAFNFFAKIAGLFWGGRRPTEMERLEFWRSVAYYSFVQVCVGSSPRQRPTAEMWQRSQQPFYETLRLLDPEFVLVLGRELWLNLPSVIQGETNVQLCTEHMPARFYARGSGNAFAFGIYHPSSPGWSYKKWEPWAQAAVRQASQQLRMRDQP